MNARDLLENLPPSTDNILMILHKYQERNARNYITEADMREVSEYLQVPYSWVYGVVSYYSMFSLTPRGKNIIRVCKSPVCHMEGSGFVLDALRENLGIGIGETTRDGLFSLEYTECLGRCDSSPVMMVNDTIYGGLDSSKVRSILESFRK